MKINYEKVDKYRDKKSYYKTKDKVPYGRFFIPYKLKVVLCVLATDAEGTGWEHVSVSTGSRCPTWEEMCFIKDLFWDEEETVLQIHPPKSEYINHHKYCLHLWRDTRNCFIAPPSILVGPK